MVGETQAQRGPLGLCLHATALDGEAGSVPSFNLSGIMCSLCDQGEFAPLPLLPILSGSKALFTM